MFRAITETQWKWTRGMALLLTLTAFAVPLLSLENARSEGGAVFLETMTRWGIWYAVLAMGVGLGMALPAWTHDQRGRHVYALSLPIARWRYALLRFGAGALFLLAPTAGVLAGSLVVSMSGLVPAGLHTYPFALSLRFFFASGVAFSLFFAIGGATSKTAGIVLGVIAAALVGQFVIGLVNADFNLLGKTAEFIFAPPTGVLSVFFGRWMLIDA